MRKEKKKGDTRKKKKLAHFFSLSLSRSEKQQQQQNRPDKPFRLAVGSFVEDYPNRVDIVARTFLAFFGFYYSFAAAVIVVTSPPRSPTSRPPLSLFSPFNAPTKQPLPVDEEAGVLRADPALGFEHPFPPTRVAFIPDRSGSAAGGAPSPSSSSCLGNAPDLLATSGDFLRIWKIESGGDDVHGNGMATDEYEDGEDDDDDENGGGGGGGGGDE